ncbi:hypothetical protein, partial [Hungatella hathewayi]
MDKQMISSAGMLFLYLAGEVSEDGAIGIHWTDSYQRSLDFYEKVSELRAEIYDKVDLEIFCVLGLSEKVDGIEAFVEGQIKERVLEICGEPGREGKGIRTDRLEADFNRLIQEYIFQERNMLFPRSCRMGMEGFEMYCLWGGTDQEDDRHLWIEETVAVWRNVEKPFLFGKQIMVQTFELSDLEGRKIIGALHDSEEEGWYLLIEGGMKLYLHKEIPYLRERIGVSDAGLFTVSEIDRITSNPVYAYGKAFQARELCEEWHKVFFFAAALTEQVWDEDAFVPVYERFLATVYKGNIIKNLIMDC